MERTLHYCEMDLTELDAACALAPADASLRGRLRWHLRTPYANVMRVAVNGELVGYACGIAFAESGWVRELFIHPARLNDGLDTPLLRLLLEWMEDRGAMRQLVIAPEEHRVLYMGCSFAVDGALLAYQDGTFLQATKDEVVNLEPEHMLAVLQLDRRATGEDREPLLREHAYLGSVYQEGTRVRGFSLPLLGHGLIVADSPDVGLELQRWLLPIQPYLRLPVGHLAAHSHMIARKYTAKSAGIRMVRGLFAPFKLEMIYAHP